MCLGDVGQQGATLVDDYPQGRVFEWFVRLWRMITHDCKSIDPVEIYRDNVRLST